MKKNVLLYTGIPKDLRQKLEQEFNLFYFRKNSSEKDFYQALATAHGLIGWGGAWPLINDELLGKAPELQVVSTISVGYDHCDVAALSKRKIILTNTPGVLTDTTADLIFALLLAVARRVAELDKLMRDGKWVSPIPPALWGVDVHHKTIGILGMGRIGQAIAQRAGLGFDMKVLYSSNQPKPDAEKRYNAKYASMEEVLAKSDFVVVTLPLNNETHGIIGKAKLDLMKPSAMLINGARGAVVDEDALIGALQNKTIAGAGLDVFRQEPLPLDSPLLKMDNVVLSPHVGSATYETRYAMAKLGVENLIAAFNGTLQDTCVNPEVLDIYK